jgi:hypothetical protein
MSAIVPRSLLVVWLAVMAGPVGWSVSLVVMFWLTHPVCQGRSRSSIFVVGALCIAIAAVGGLMAWRQSKRARSARDDVSLFLCEIAIWSAAIFALVIALSLVPAGLLTPCPV